MYNKSIRLSVVVKIVVNVEIAVLNQSSRNFAQISNLAHRQTSFYSEGFGLDLDIAPIYMYRLICSI